METSSRPRINGSQLARYIGSYVTLVGKVQSVSLLHNETQYYIIFSTLLPVLLVFLLKPVINKKLLYNLQDLW